MVTEICEYTKNHQINALNEWTVWYANYIFKKSFYKKKKKRKEKIIHSETLVHIPCSGKFHTP